MGMSLLERLSLFIFVIVELDCMEGGHGAPVLYLRKVDFILRNVFASYVYPLSVDHC